MTEEDELNLTKRFANRTVFVIWSHNRSPRFWLISGLGGENSANYGHCCSESNRHADS